MAKLEPIGTIYRKKKDDSWILWVLGGFVLIAVLAA